ncbi:PH domain-containing protein [Rothia sp. P5764]|uniref:PH domain-containing protein n=1 Tax=Rothia sp. P5764 TaxID=3402654 RepID=UPI003AD619CA
MGSVYGPFRRFDSDATEGEKGGISMDDISWTQPSPNRAEQKLFSPTLPPLDLDGAGRAVGTLPEVSWKGVSIRYVRVRLIARLIWSLGLTGAAFLPLVFTRFLGWWDWPLWLSYLLPALVLALNIWLSLLVKGQVLALGYSERQDHLLVRRGLMFRSVTAIPYGRIQYIDVTSGPILNALNLANVEVRTAANSTTVPGLDRTIAENLREVLTDLSDAKMVGL